MYSKAKKGSKIESLSVAVSLYQSGRANFFCPQILNPQNLGLIPLSKICKFLRCASPKIANLHIFMIYQKIANPQIS
jgi:hypothetical protein